MTNAKWYTSKIVWAGVVVTVLGILPIINLFVKVIDPTASIIIDATCAMIAGVLTVIWRIWFTNTTISTAPPTV